MLERLFVDNYKCLVNFELHLDEMSLLLGPNGTGKSAILGVVAALRELIKGVAKVTDEGVFPTSTLTRWQDRTCQIFEIRAALGGAVFDYHLEVEHEIRTQRARVTKETLHSAERPLFTFIIGDVQLYRDDGTKGPSYSADWSESALARVVPQEVNSKLSRFVDFLSRVVVCSLHPPAFRAESKAEDSWLAGDASNYADWHRHVVQENPELILPFIERLRDTLERGFSSIRLERVGKNTRDLVAVFDAPNNGSRYELRFDELSDGQRALVVLYGLIHLARGQDQALFLDEPDNYLALREMQPWIGALEDAVGDAVPQAVICSHHPEIIDYLGTECGVFLAREQGGLVTMYKPDIPDEPGLKLSEAIARGWEA